MIVSVYVLGVGLTVFVVFRIMATHMMFPADGSKHVIVVDNLCE